jgi:hypothetical protein
MDPVAIIVKNWETTTAAPLAAFLLIVAGFATGFAALRLSAKDT